MKKESRMNNWGDYELLFEILVISINVLWYSAIIAGVVEWIVKKVRVRNDKRRTYQKS